MTKTKKVYIVLIIILLFALMFIGIRRVYSPFLNNTEPKIFSNVKDKEWEFISNDKKISFKCNAGTNIEKNGNLNSFWIIGDAGGDIGKIANFGFNFIENRKGDINELYKENVFYKKNPKYFYGKKEILISGNKAILSSFCDEEKCMEENMVHEIFIKYKDIIYSFQFGDKILEKKVLDSIKFN